MKFYDISVKNIDGDMVALSQYQGKVVLIVNTASGCGFTPQFKGLEALYEEFGAKEFVVLGFPCNQFKEQDPGTNSEIKSFCQLQYGVSFPMFAKIDVNGNNESPLYTFLKKEKGGWFGKNIKWNFTKFLIDRNGNVVKRYAPTTTPEQIKKDVLRLIN